jgi:hypothetical protein
MDKRTNIKCKKESLQTQHGILVRLTTNCWLRLSQQQSCVPWYEVADLKQKLVLAAFS